MNKPKTNVITFIKRNAAYIILALCILAIGLSVTFAIIGGSKDLMPEGNNPSIETPNPDDKPDETPDDNPTTNPDENPTVETITFIMPVSNPSKINDYSDTMVFNSTLDRFSTHKALDFFVEEGAPVYAVWDGVVESVTNDVLKGVTVVLDHGNGLKTVYNSLADVDAVTEGQRLNKGDVLGEASVTNRQEHADGAHLHFEVMEDGVVIDPAKYLTIDEK